jgi:hypothetical protein
VKITFELLVSTAVPLFSALATSISTSLKSMQS